MGHRHAFNTSQMFETDSNQGWHYTDESYENSALAGGTENESLLHPADNMSTDAPNFSFPWNPSSGLDRYCPSSRTVEGPNHQASSAGPSRNPFTHSFASGSFFTVPENHGHYTSSSNHSEQTFHGFEGTSVDLVTGNERGAYKQKGTVIPSVHERGSTSRYDGRSFDFSVSSELRHDKPNVEFHQTPFDYSTFRPMCTGNSFATSGEDSLRNVRSRDELVSETSLGRTHLNNPSQHSLSTAHFIQNSDTPAVEWNRTIISTAPHDTAVFNHETNPYVMEGGFPSASLRTGGYDIDFVAHRNTGTPVPQYLQGTTSQPLRGNQTSFTHQSNPAFRSSSSYFHVADLDESFPLVAERYSSRHARSSPNTGWHSSNQNGQIRFSNERRLPLSYEGGVRNRLASQGHPIEYRHGFALVDQSASYGFRTSFDQHRDMRLDIDDMSYEELLALGERIGSVNTGLSDVLIKMCMTDSIYCSSDITEDEGGCAICLEEYKYMDDVGMLKTCHHDFHVGCIRKWLLQKNMCPICKSSVVADHMKDK